MVYTDDPIGDPPNIFTGETIDEEEEDDDAFNVVSDAFNQAAETAADFVGSGDRYPARIGTFYLKYQDPSVDVNAEQRTTEHETIDDTIIIQTMGRRAKQITINAVVADYEAHLVDQLVEMGVVTLRTSRWSGDVVVTSTNTTFRREKDKEGAWLYDASIECLEAN